MKLFAKSFSSYIFVLKIKSAANIQEHFILNFIVEINTVNPDQTAPFRAVWPRSILFAIKATQEHEQTRGANNKSRD